MLARYLIEAAQHPMDILLVQYFFELGELRRSV
jgi:hypothetical protein